MTDADNGGAPEGVPIDNPVDTTSPVENLAPDAPEQKEEPAKKPTLRESIKKADKAAKERAEKETEAAEKPKDSQKAEAKEDPAKKDAEKPEKARGEDGKFAGKETAAAEKSETEKPAAGRDGDEGRSSEGRKHSEPPARFLPEAREKWQNTPYQVKDEVHRISQEYEREIEESRTIRERYEPIRQYDDIAKSNGRNLGESLQKVVEIEQALARNPIAGLDMILREVGPRKADGSPMSIMDVAQFVAQQSPEQMRALMQQQQPQQQRQPNPEVAGLRQEIQRMQTQMASSTLMPVVEQFAAKHPDYHSLEPQIAAVLRSGVVDQVYGSGLSPEQKLAAAYRMAGGQPAPSHANPPNEPENSQAERAANPAGQLSVKGAPSGDYEAAERKKPSPSIRAALERASRNAAR